jgi:hypothetical protein
MNLLARVRRMSREEIASRATQALRIQRDRLAARIRRPRWDRSKLAGVLAADVLDPVLRTHLARRDWGSAHRSLARALRARPRVFALDPTSASELRDAIVDRWPEAPAQAASRAERVLQGRYDLLGYKDLSFGRANSHIDWHFDPVHERSAPRRFWADVPFLDPQIGDHKVVWELNRHQHWLALGRALWLTRDRKFGWAMVSQLEDWLAANPPLTGVNWASALELGFRSLSWTYGLHFLLADMEPGAAGPSQTPWLVDLLVGLDRQMQHVEENLSRYFSPNTHLTGEALALYVTGVALPELAASRRRATTGRDILLDQIAAQIAADGGHVERSAHYHRYTLDFYLLALLTAERAQDTEAITRFTDAVTRLAEFARTLADDNGRTPLIGDDDGGMLWPIAGREPNDVRDSLALAAIMLGRPDLAPWGVPEEVFWIAGRTAIEFEPFVEEYRTDAPPPRSATLADTGFVVARDGLGGHLVFDAGPHGFMNGGHAHTDALAVTLAVNGHPLLIDPGTSTYTMDLVLRDRMRSSTSHNTLTLDGESPSIPAGPFHWHSRADARLDAARHNPAFDWAEGTHDGYRHSRHRRTVLRVPAGGWLIVDEVLGRGRHAADLHWHFDPAWDVTNEAPTLLRATRDPDKPNAAGTTVWIVHDGSESRLLRGDEATGLGWCAPNYGTLMPTWTARVSRTAAVPFSIVSFMSTSPAPSQVEGPPPSQVDGPAPSRVDGRVRDTEASIAPPQLARLGADCDPGGARPIAVRVVDGNITWTTLLRPGEAAVRETRGGRVGAYHTNARVLQYGVRDNRLVSLCLCDATHALALRDDWLSVAADEPIPDLYVECLGNIIDVWSSTPMPRLQLQGAVVTAASHVRLNGRELSIDARDRADSVTVSRPYFEEPGRVTPCVALQVSRI